VWGTLCSVAAFSASLRYHLLSIFPPFVFISLRIAFSKPFIFTTIRIAPCVPLCPLCSDLSVLCVALSPLFSNCYGLFVAAKKLNPFAIKQIHALSAKHPGWGVASYQSASGFAGGAVPDQERRLFLFEGLRGVGLEATAAACFVHAGGADYDEFVAFYEALGVHGRIAAAHADG
jgi:hypothetical protein